MAPLPVYLPPSLPQPITNGRDLSQVCGGFFCCCCFCVFICQPLFLDKPLSNAEPAFGQRLGPDLVCLASQFSCVAEPEEKTPYPLATVPAVIQSVPLPITTVKVTTGGQSQSQSQVIEKETVIYCKIICTFTCCGRSRHNCFT